jgi:hypothetical protein
MNLLVKSAIASALALGATGAYAIGLPANNNSDLVLVIENQTTFATYALDTGISLSSVMPTGSLVSGAILDTSISIASSTTGPSATLSSFLAANPASSDAWALEGGQYNGNGNSSTKPNSEKAGNALAIFASPNGTAVNAEVNNYTLANLSTFENGLQQSFVTGGLTALQTATETTAASYTQDSGSPNSKYTLIGGGVNDLATLGSTAVQLFGFTGNGGTGVVQSYILGTATVGTNGTLTISGSSGAAPVPLPAAVWLFGSGLLGLVGVSRRRKSAVAV